MEEVGHNDWKKRRMVKTVCLVASWLSAGMYMGLIGPALIDLTEIANCNYEQLAYALTAKNAGLVVAALASAVLCSRFQRHLEAILSLNLILLGLSTAAVPWCSLLPLMATAMMCQGLTHGVLGVAGNSWIAIMWAESTAGPLHALHFGNAIGGVLAPLIIRPFLSPDSNHTVTVMVPTAYFTANNSGDYSASRIQIPFGGYGLYTVFCGITFLCFYVVDRRSPEKQGLFYFSERKKSALNEVIITRHGTFAGVKKPFGIFMAVVLCLMYTSMNGMYQAIPTYLMPLSVQGPLHMSKAAGNLLLFGYTLSLVVGRLLATILSKCLSTQFAVFYEIVACFGLSVAIYFFSFNTVALMWSLTCAFSFTTAPLFPAGISWAGMYLEITGPLMAVFFVGGGLGALLFNWLCGYGIENFGIYFPLQANLGATSATSFFYLIAALSFWHYGRRRTRPAESNKEEKPTVPNERQPLIN